MSEPDRCYKCGRIAPGSKSMERRLKIQIGGDGWRPAENAEGRFYGYHDVTMEDGTRIHTFLEDAHVLGSDPDIICPRCECDDGAASARRGPEARRAESTMGPAPES